MRHVFSVCLKWPLFIPDPSGNVKLCRGKSCNTRGTQVEREDLKIDSEPVTFITKAE